MIIDIHAHFIPRQLYERFDAEAAKFPGVKLLRSDAGVRMQFPGGEPTRPISPKLSDLADRIAWMDKAGIDDHRACFEVDWISRSRAAAVCPAMRPNTSARSMATALGAVPWKWPVISPAA